MRVEEVEFYGKNGGVLSLEYSQAFESVPSKFIYGSSANPNLEIIRLSMHLDWSEYVLLEQRNRQEEKNWLYLTNAQPLPSRESGYSDLKEYDVTETVLFFKSCGGLDAFRCIRNGGGSLLEVHMPTPWSRTRIEASLYLDRRYAAPLL